MKKPNITEGNWQWIYHDKSMMSLAGSVDGIENHVLAQSPCENCQARLEEGDDIFGECYVVNHADGKAISAVPELIDALIETDKDLCVLESTMRAIEISDSRAEGMVQLVIEWRKRNKQALLKAGCTDD